MAAQDSESSPSGNWGQGPVRAASVGGQGQAPEGRAPSTAEPGGRQRPVIWLRPDTLARGEGLTAVGRTVGAQAQAIASQVMRSAARFAASGENASIDLRFLKSMPEERQILEGMLGKGEVSASVDSLGRTDVQETAIPCVWWLRHRDSDGATVTEVLEITAIPELLQGDRTAITAALEGRCTAWGYPAPKAATATPISQAR